MNKQDHHGDHQSTIGSTSIGDDGTNTVLKRVLGQHFRTNDELLRTQLKESAEKYKDPQWLNEEKERLRRRHEYRQLITRVQRVVKQLESVDDLTLAANRSLVFDLVTRGVTLIEQSQFFLGMTHGDAQSDTQSLSQNDFTRVQQSLMSVDSELEKCERRKDSIMAQYSFLNQLLQQLSQQQTQDPVQQQQHQEPSSATSLQEAMQHVISRDLERISTQFREASEHERTSTERRDQFEEEHADIYELVRLYIRLQEYNRQSTMRSL